MLEALVGGSLDEVGVVAAAFDCSGIGTVAAGRIHLSSHVGQGFGVRFLSMFRGKNPPVS
jgi:hypothetical protein